MTVLGTDAEIFLPRVRDHIRKVVIGLRWPLAIEAGELAGLFF
jgi:hypothetical protein